MKKIIWIIILVLSLGLAVVAGYNVYTLNQEYQAGISEYKELEQYVAVVEESPAKEEVEEEVEEEPLIPVKINVNFDHLMTINEDLVGWIYYEPLEISYPIVRGDDNEYYTEYTFENEQNNSGAIFMDFLNKPDMSNYNTIIYGHNMRNGTMFGSLKQLLSDNTIITGDPYFYVYTKDRTYMYEIASAYYTSASSDTYDLIKTEEEQQEYIEYIKGASAYFWEKEILPQDKIMTLSTCHGLHSTNRTVIHGILIAQEDRQ